MKSVEKTYRKFFLYYIWAVDEQIVNMKVTQWCYVYTVMTLCIVYTVMAWKLHSEVMYNTWHWVRWCFRAWYLMTCSVWQIFLMTSGIDHQYFKMWMSRLTSVLSRENWESCDKWWIDTLWCIPYNTTCWWSHLDNWWLDRQCSWVDHAEPQHWRTISSEEIEQ